MGWDGWMDGRGRKLMDVMMEAHYRWPMCCHLCTYNTTSTEDNSTSNISLLANKSVLDWANPSDFLDNLCWS